MSSPARHEAVTSGGSRILCPHVATGLLRKDDGSEGEHAWSQNPNHTTPLSQVYTIFNVFKYSYPPNFMSHLSSKACFERYPLQSLGVVLMSITTGVQWGCSGGCPFVFIQQLALVAHAAASKTAWVCWHDEHHCGPGFPFTPKLTASYSVGW
eukprot:5893289-Amphidinium_carterae.1